MPKMFKDKAFDVEHALIMYAKSYVTMPAFGIYEDELIAPLLEQIRHCHIYIIGLTPKLEFVGAAQEEQVLITSVEIGSQCYDLRWQLPEGVTLKGNNQDGWYVEDGSGDKYFPTESMIGQRLSAEHNAVDFEVLYIGQAFGESGSRNALDRLKKHETLQKIAVKGIPGGYSLTILMLAVEPANQLVTTFNPWAKDKSQGAERIKKGLDKLFGTTEAERTTLYEASLIRYFQPKFNKEFKNSFPSTNMKLLADCYDKDFSALVAEISIDELPFQLFSDVVAHKPNHIAKHDLHTDENRRVFFA
ncbi:hypothetical protein [Cereibacter azotoformans]|uniref:hypothetical protein n=1 Tax=Cereibacter azotoformans TaxID=43057 RepID=UPI00195D3AB3|nr:hypothetical protein [Cereibacter azotoformans]